MTELASRPRTGPLWQARAGYVAARTWLGRFPLSLILLGLRIGIGSVFLNSALIRIRSWEFGVLLFRQEFKLPLIDPELAARLATSVELSMPILLFAGLATRLATIPLLAMTLVIQVFVFPGSWPTHLFWAAALLLVLTRGPGVFSIDYLVERFVFRRR